jgi:hypothetical protein
LIKKYDHHLFSTLLSIHQLRFAADETMVENHSISTHDDVMLRPIDSDLKMMLMMSAMNVNQTKQFQLKLHPETHSKSMPKMKNRILIHMDQIQREHFLNSLVVESNSISESIAPMRYLLGRVELDQNLMMKMMKFHSPDKNVTTKKSGVI